jgi:hypothetical protein
MVFAAGTERSVDASLHQCSSSNVVGPCDAHIAVVPVVILTKSLGRSNCYAVQV